MTKEQYLKLIKYEQIFSTAINSLYYRALDSRFASDFISVCRELNVYYNTSCPLCTLKSLQTLGRLYFSFKEELEKKKTREPEIEFPSEPLEAKDDKPIKSEKKVHLSASKQPKKTNKK